MLERDLKAFIDATVHYFRKMTGEPATTGEPTIQFLAPELLDYTGVITISGSAQGVVYLTAPQPMLEMLLREMGEEDLQADHLRDVVGEVANTVAGYVRKDFGSSFGISIPRVIAGAAATPLGNGPSFVVPVEWRRHTCQLVIAVEETETVAAA